MNKFLERSSNNVSISNFFEEYTVGKYDMNPPYQRLSVWSSEKKAFFIDSILKNLPVPPVFLRQKINSETGKTSYEVIDGKQRLTSIVEFIDDMFATADESEDPFHDEELAGKLFSELEGEKLSIYKKLFWRYQIPVEYIDSEDPVVIDRIFDRLNRNGEPLTGQELRHSSYYNSKLLKLCYSLSKNLFWSERLKTTDKARMEDIEFISELIFSLLENSEISAISNELDEYYAKYSKDGDVDWVSVETSFYTITTFMEGLMLDYDRLRISGVSHLYGLWCFSMVCIEKDIQVENIAPRLLEFFELSLKRDYSNPASVEYKRSMSNATKLKWQRTKRKNALVGYSGIVI